MVQLTEYQWIQKCTRYRTIDKHDKRLVVTMIQKKTPSEEMHKETKLKRGTWHTSVLQRQWANAQRTHIDRDAM